MNWYKFTMKTACGKTNVVIQQADTLQEAKDKYFKHNVLKHTPMTVIKIEVKNHETWFAA